MNYFNKFQNLVSKGVTNVKNAINGPQKHNAYIEKGMSTMYEGDPNDIGASPFQEQNQPKKTTSLSEFLLQGNKTNQSQTNQIGNDVIAINPYNIQNRRESKPDDDFMNGFKLIEGENPVEWERCIIKLDDKEFNCRALITAYRLYLIPHFSSNNLITSLNSMTYESLFPPDFFSLPIHKILSCEKSIEKTNTFQYSIVIYSKDGRSFELILRIGQSEAFFFCLSGLIQAKEKPTYSTFAMKYCAASAATIEENGWDVYDPEKEFARQGLRNLDTNTSQDKNKLFRRTKLNEKYGLCDTYPKFLITSAHITDEELRNGAAFRTKNRIPSLSYFYYKNKASIWRSSQTKSGITNNRNAFDEQLLGYISDLGSEKRMVVYDARPYLSACANRLKGAGFEDVSNYNRCDIIFCEIDNIHDARNSLSKIYNMLRMPEFREYKKFYSTFESTGWPEFVHGIIRSAIKIANSIKQGCSCLIHCSDGWDRASQLTAFSQLLIDPYYRTIKGYMTLIEKDFLSFGHQFKYRNGYYSGKEFHEDQNSPIFLQYLDATHQLLVQYPMYFEFNMNFLLYIANHINSGKYGTFLYNHERERDEKEAKMKTMSIWTDMLKNIDKYRNPYYENRTLEEYFFVPMFSSHKIRLWEEYFMQFTQLGVGLSYDRYINRWYKWKEEKKPPKDTRIITNIQFINRDKKEENTLATEQGFEIDKLKACIMDLLTNAKMSVEAFEKIPESSRKMIKKITEEKEGVYANFGNEKGYEFVKIEKVKIGDKSEEPKKEDSIPESKKDNSVPSEEKKLEPQEIIQKELKPEKSQATPIMEQKEEKEEETKLD